MDRRPPFTGDLESTPTIPKWPKMNKPIKRDSALLQTWYQLTSPAAPGPSAPFQERDLFRRGRTGSQISIALFFMIIISFPAALAGVNTILIITLVANLLIVAFALVFNRLGMVNTAGVMVVLGVVAGPIANILTAPGGVNTSVLPIFTFLVLPLMCAVSFLAPGWVFVVAAGNCLFTLYALRFLPVSGELQQVLNTAFPVVVAPIILSQIIVSVVAFLWVQGAKQAILRADQAERVTELVMALAQRDHAIALQKTQLDASIRQIELVHEQVANGITTARVPLTQDNVLWSIGGKLNNLLTRFHRLQMQVNELQRVIASLQQSQEERQSRHKSKDTSSGTTSETKRYPST
ncbi:hypothetical protein KSF_093650 [Reticulibacter mediterranei]|uniref:Uncharacterized protein n=1 Tax=Reticulibacter mediterranei TaxID=2778369 RepID=A0A8J3N9G9_9CHLR|nr:hypothetical protein [Reticulibacter mediterranei]GHO99317.1 hypothetical protein KSF_093650 [Reticulibacter mediterranei]